MRLLIAGAPSKIFHLKEFGEELKKQGHEYHLVTYAQNQEGQCHAAVSGREMAPSRT